MSGTREQYRQGDILLVRVGEIPQGSHKVPREDGLVVLARGEATGHLHEVRDEAASLWRKGESWNPRQGLYLRAEDAVTLRHNEHASIELPPGVYRMVRQRRWLPSGSSAWVED